MTETIAVVFTDLVDSTKLLSALGDEAFDEVRRDHFDVLGSVIEQHGGEEVKNLGDGVMAVFRSASDAITAAVAMQVESERRGRRAGATRVGLKVGVSIGDATSEQDDWFGTPVVEAARLVARCGPGEILVTDLLRVMAGSRTDATFERLGEIELKGLPEPVAVSAIRWVPAGTASSVPLPSTLQASAGLPFVGRTEALAALRAAGAAALAGQARTVLVSGEPGIGKTRLAAEGCGELHEAGATVVLGRSEDHIDVPFRPFAEALEQLVRHGDDDVVEAHLHARGDALSFVLPSLAVRARATSAPAAEVDANGDGIDAGERVEVFDAAVDLLRRQAEVSPVVVVLDDLHWADRSSLLLLRHLVTTLGDARVLIVGTYRDTDVDRHHPLAEVLADLRSVPGVERLSLQGLDEGEVAQYLALAGGRELDADGLELGRALAGITDGNPFFVGETLRHLTEVGALVEADGRWLAGDVGLEEVGVPEGIKEVVGRRLAALADDTEHVLRVAAVAGTHFDSAVVAAVAATAEDAVLDGLDAACERSLAAEDVDRFGWYRFAHALVRQTLLEELSATRRVRLHLALGEELSRRAPDRLEEIAHHYLEAAAAGVGARAVELALAAGRQALDRAAIEQAVHWFERALEAEATLAPDPERHATVAAALEDARARTVAR